MPRITDPRPRRAAADPSEGRAGRAAVGGWAVVTLLSLAVAAVAVTPYLVQSLTDLAGSAGGLAGNYADRPLPIRIAFYAHVVAGGVALVASPWQFSGRLRRRLPRLHRGLGRVALVGVGIAGVAGLTIAPVNRAGLVGVLGFSGLAVLWLHGAWRAYRTAVSRDLAAHREWAVRTFALTFAAVTLRLWLLLLIVAQLASTDGPVTDAVADAAFANAYAVVPFLCWVPNVMVAEYLVRRRRRSSSAGRR